MPVFHTKTIEAILEPVAQQVSELVILHEKSESGLPIPDLSGPIMAVGQAVQNLTLIGRQTLQGSKDKTLKQEMPVALQRVEESAMFLMEASGLLKKDPLSIDARKKLINGARGILSGTSTLLLTFDDAEVRKILKACKSLLEYLRVSELVEIMPDVITFVKNLTPAVFNMVKLVESRQADLTHKVHQDLLKMHCNDVKKSIPTLITAMKAFVVTLERGGPGRAEAQENRNFRITKLSDDILEIMRILQLKVYDEEEGEDPTTEMRKAQGVIAGKMDQAKDWLSNPAADANGLGERAIRDILKQARLVGVAGSDPRIGKVCDELDQLMDNLSSLRARGMGGSPEAMQLANEIGKRLDYLQMLVDDTIAKEAASGRRLPAPTTVARAEQALHWINDPTGAPDAVGRRAVSVLIMEGRGLAENLDGPERIEMLRTCDKIEQLTNELANLKARGKGNSPEAKKIAQQLSAEVEKLQGLMQKALARSVVEHFMDPIGPLNALSKAAYAPPGQPNRDADYEEKAGAFEHACNLMSDTAEQAASTGGATNKHLRDMIKNKVMEVRLLTPQCSHAGKLLLASNGDAATAENFEGMKNELREKLDELTGLVDMATAAPDFIKASEEMIKRDSEAAVTAAKQSNLPIVVEKSSRIARCAGRIVQVAKGEVENIEDPKFKNDVNHAAEALSQRISPLILYAKSVASKPQDKASKDGFVKSMDDIKDSVADLRKIFIPDMPDMSKLKLTDAGPARPPPPRPPLPAAEVIEPQEAQVFEAVLKAPPADNRMAVAAHHLHSEATKWEEEGNAIITAAKHLALLFAKMSKFVSEGESPPSKKELIDTAKLIAIGSGNVVKLAKEVAEQCPDKRLRQVLNQTVERIPTISTQLKILATVKATMFGSKDAQADLEATEMLVGCAENLMSAVRQTVKETEAASVKIRGPSWQWKRSIGWLFGDLYDLRKILSVHDDRSLSLIDTRLHRLLKMPRKKKQAIAANYNFQATWELHYVSYFLRVFKKLFNLKKTYVAEFLEKEICYESIQSHFGEDIARVVEYLTKEENLGATNWEVVLEEQMCKNAVHPNILKGTDFNSLDPEQRLQLLKILVDLVREVREEEIAVFGRSLKSKSLRFKSVGKDKHENNYWTFGSSRLFREFSKPNSRRFESVCTTASEWEGFILTLRPSPNKNEKELHKSLKHVWGKIKDHIQLAQLKMKGTLELSQMAVKEHFELKRHAEAIEAIESDLEKPKMTKLVKMPPKLVKQKEKDSDRIISPMLGTRPVLQNGSSDKFKKRPVKPKVKKRDDKIKSSKLKENLLHRTEKSNVNVKKTDVVMKPKVPDDESYSPEAGFNQSEDEPPIPEELRRKIEMDDPGIDLSVFKPLGKRKCVIALEERKGKSWYEGDDDITDEEIHQDSFRSEKEAPKKKKRKIKPVIPAVAPLMPAPLPLIPDPPIIKSTTTPGRTCVFSTALANRGAYEVIIKGKYNTIIAYHQAQKWPTAYLQHHIHCEPFVPEELKNEPALYTSDDASAKSYKSSEEENIRPVVKAKKKAPPRKKKVIRKFSESASASSSSPALEANHHLSSDHSEREIPSLQNIDHSDNESSSSDKDQSNSDGESGTELRRTGNNHLIANNKNFREKKANSMKEWQKQLGIDDDEELDYRDQYHKYLYNNNNKKVDMRFFPPGSGIPNYRNASLSKQQQEANGARKKQRLSRPRPSPLNQPTSVSIMRNIPDELSEEDDDDDSMASESDDDKEREDSKERELSTQNIVNSPKVQDAGLRKASSERSLEHPASPASSKHSLSDADIRSQLKEQDRLPVDRFTDSSTSASPIARNPPQAASVIANSRTSNSTPLHISTPSENVSASPRNSPQLSPFAAYRGRPATYPAEITVNPKPATNSSPLKMIPDNSEKVAQEYGADFNGPSSALSRPSSLQLEKRDSPSQRHQHPSHVQVYSSNLEPRSQRTVGIPPPRMSPQVSDSSSVIQRQNPSPSSAIDNLCSPAIPMHCQTTNNSNSSKSPSIPPIRSSSSPIFIQDVVNGNMNALSPASPHVNSSKPSVIAAGGGESSSQSSNLHSVISPVIANHMHEFVPSRTRSSPVVQAYSSATFNGSAAQQRIPSPVQHANAHMQRMPLHPGQADANLLSSMYRQHRMTRLPSNAKPQSRGQASSSAVEEQTRRMHPGMLHGQQVKAYSNLAHGLGKESSQLSQYAQAGMEQGHAFHGPHGNQEASRSAHASLAALQGVPDSVKSHMNMQSRSLYGMTHNSSQDSSKSFLGAHYSGADAAARAQFAFSRATQSSPRTHIGLSASSQDSSRTISGMAQSAQEAARNVLGMPLNNGQDTPRTHQSASHSSQETSRSHHAVPHIASQELSRSHHPLSHVLHEQSRYPGMPHSFHHGLNRTLHESAHSRGLHEVQHGVRPSIPAHSFQQGLRNLPESPVGKSPPTQSIFHHAHGREFPSPSAALKSYPSSLVERTMLEHQQQSRLLEHQQQARILEQQQQQQQQTRKSFSVESLTASSEASDRGKGQSLNGQPTTPSALSRPGYSPSQRSHMFGHFPAYTRGPSPEFFKLPPHVQQIYAARGALGPYVNFSHFKG
eukprot:gene16841-18540_t